MGKLPPCKCAFDKICNAASVCIVDMYRTLDLNLSLSLSLFLSLCLTEDAYRIDAEIDGEVVGLDILDTAGQEVFSAVRDRYMRDGEGFLLVYSLLERSTFVGITKISEQIKRVKDTDKHVPIILIGNKVHTTYLQAKLAAVAV